MIDNVLHDRESAKGVDPVAVIGPVWQFLWCDPDPIPTIAKKRGLKIGDKLYAAPMLASARVPDGWQLVRVSDLQKIAAPVGTDMDSSTTNSYRAAIYHRELYERRSLAESMLAAAQKLKME